MKKKNNNILIMLIVIGMILNEIFTAMELIWYIQLIPFTVVLTVYFIIVIKSRSK